MSDHKNYLFTSESVSEGHPDKVSDRISDMVVDSYLEADPFSRVACETLTTTNKVVLAGEVRGPEIKKDELIEKVRSCIKDIGYDQKGFSWKNANIETFLHEQSADIAMGVDSKNNKDEGAGDQGIMFGYACKETEDLMPAPIHFSHKILRLMAEDRKKGILKGIEPDSKSQVTMLYENNKPSKVVSVVISTQHSEDLNQEKVKEFITPYIKKSIPEKFIKDLDTNEGFLAAERCGLAIISQIKKTCNNDLSKIKSCVKITGYVNSTDDFTDQPKVINGASEIISKIFEDKGLHARAAISLNSLPRGVAVEVDAIFELN